MQQNLQHESKDKLWNIDYVKVLAANAMMYFAFYLLAPLLPIYLTERFGTTKDVIGLVLFGYTVAALLFRPFSGYIVDSFNRKKVLMACVFAFAACFAGYLVAGTLLMFAIVRTVHGGPFGAATVANSTAAIDVLPSTRRTEGLGYYGLSNNLAMAVAPSAGIYIYEACHNFTVLFWIALIVAIIGFLIDSSVKIPVKDIVENRGKFSLDRFFLTRAWLLAINIALFGFCFGVLSNYLAIYSRDVMGITDGTGTYFAFLSLGLVCSRLQGAKSLRQGHVTHNAAYGMIIALVGYTVFVAFPNLVGYYLSACLIGLGNGHMYPAFLNMFVATARHDQRGTANSSILTSWDFGFGIGILLGGIVSQFFGYSAAFWMVVGDNVCGVVLFFLATRKFFLKRRLEPIS
nr:MFS transporter [uncultured Prevotella sp.]